MMTPAHIQKASWCKVANLPESFPRPCRVQPLAMIRKPSITKCQERQSGKIHPHETARCCVPIYLIRPKIESFVPKSESFTPLDNLASKQQAPSQSERPQSGCIVHTTGQSAFQNASSKPDNGNHSVASQMLFPSETSSRRTMESQLWLVERAAGMRASS